MAQIVKNYMRLSQKKLYKLSTNIPEKNNTNLYIMEKIRQFLQVKTVTSIKRTKNKFI
jgi:hypothetical protein